MAGTPADYQQAAEFKSLWQSYGMKSWLTPYEILLTYPDKNNPDFIELQSNNGDVLYRTQLYEKILRPEQNQSDVVPPFNAFSGSGSPKVSIFILL
jgi:hypothetical protein